MNLADFSTLSAPALITELDFETVYEERKAAFLALYTDATVQAEMSKTLERESDPVVKLLQESAYREVLFRQQRNDDVKALLVLYSSGSNLDQLVVDRGLKRLIITPADNTVVPPVDAVYESDHDLKERYLLAMDGLSVAGPVSSYQFYAESADGRVGDVSVVSPQVDLSNIVLENLTKAQLIQLIGNLFYLDIYILQNDSETGVATQELINIVQVALDDEKVRPCCDKAIVKSVSVINYSIVATIFAKQTAQAAAVLEIAQQNLQSYVAEQKRIGRSIRRSAIYAALHVDGIEHVDITLPAADIVIDATQAGHCTNIDISVEAYE